MLKNKLIELKTQKQKYNVAKILHKRLMKKQQKEIIK